MKKIIILIMVIVMIASCATNPYAEDPEFTLAEQVEAGISLMFIFTAWISVIGYTIYQGIIPF